MKLKITFILVIVFFGLLMTESVNAQPPAITDLKCVFSEMPGAVWLTWTPPIGANSYDVRYALSPINAGNYNLAYQFPQNWSGATSQGLVTNLAENNTWFFVIKAINGGLPSDISNVVYCFVPIKIIAKDETPPTSSITDPKEGETILAGKDYIIKGESSDTGGSSVQKVEISFDDGKTWILTQPKKSLGTGFTFEYLWKNPTAGVYTIKTRATDWWENRETPGPGIEITVATELVEEKLVEEITINELQTKITEIQQKIVELLKKVVQLLQQQIAEIQTKIPK